MGCYDVLHCKLNWWRVDYINRILFILLLDRLDIEFDLSMGKVKIEFPGNHIKSFADFKPLPIQSPKYFKSTLLSSTDSLISPYLLNNNCIITCWWINIMPNVRKPITIPPPSNPPSWLMNQKEINTISAGWWSFYRDCCVNSISGDVLAAGQVQDQGIDREWVNLGGGRWWWKH